MSNVSRNEKVFVVLTFLIIFILIQSPVIWGYLSQTEDMVFTGRTLGITNFYTYSDWIIQAKEGNFLFTTYRTSEDVPPNFMNILFFGIGIISLISGLDFMIVYFGFYVIFGLLMSMSIYYFISYITENVKIRKPMFIIALTSSGVGFITWILFKITEAPLFFSENVHISQRIFPVDLWLTDAFPLMTLHTYLLHTVSIFLIVSIFYYFIKGWDNNSIKLTIISSILTSVLIATHVYDMITVYLVILIFVLVSIIKKKRYDKIKLYILYVVTSIPLFLFNILIYLYDPVFSEISKFNIVPSPNPYSYLLGSGIILLLAIYFSIKKIVPEYDNIDERILFVFIWMVSIFLLLYSPVAFQARFSMGMQIPIAILGSLALFELVLPRIKKVNSKHVLIIIIIFMMMSNILFVAKEFYKTSLKEEPYFINKYDLEAIDWVIQNTDKNDVVFSGIKIGAPISGRSHKVYLGQVDMTINSNKKIDVLNMFFSNDSDDFDKQYILSKNNISYIYYGKEESEISKIDIESLDFLEKVFENERVKIFKVI